MNNLSIIVAVSENNLIGINNGLPWHLSADLKRLRELTMGHHLIMGRKTYESIGRPLSGRTIVIITRDKNYHAPGCIVVSSLEEALITAKKDNEPFIFGGGEIFSAALPSVNKIYMTRIHQRFEGDTYFPELNKEDWKEVYREKHVADGKDHFDYSYVNLERKKPGKL